MEADEPASPAAVQGGQGLQAGSGNVQHNTWVVSRPDPGALTALNARAAADYLAGLAGHDAALVLAAAPAEAAAEALSALADSDEAGAIALLARVKRATAEQIVAAPPAAGTWLADLPRGRQAGRRRGLHVFPPRRRHPVQHRLRGPAVATEALASLAVVPMSARPSGALL